MSHYSITTSLILLAWLPKGEGDEDPQIKEGNKDNKVKQVISEWDRGTTWVQENVYARSFLSRLFNALKAEGLYLLLAAKAGRRRKEERRPKAQRQRPEQQHQPHSSSRLISRSRRLLKRPCPSCLPPPLLSLLQGSSCYNLQQILMFQKDSPLVCLPSSQSCFVLLFYWKRCQKECTLSNFNVLCLGFNRHR